MQTFCSPTEEASEEGNEEHYQGKGQPISQQGGVRERFIVPALHFSWLWGERL